MKFESHYKHFLHENTYENVACRAIFSDPRTLITIWIYMPLTRVSLRLNLQAFFLNPNDIICHAYIVSTVCK